MKKCLIVISGLVFLAGCATSPGGVAVQEDPLVTGKAEVQQAAEPAAVADQPVNAEQTNDPAADAQEPVNNTVIVQHQFTRQYNKAFLVENLKKEGVKELTGGVQYRVIQAGSGVSPTLNDTVDVNFYATRSDGTMFATTYSGDNATPRAYQVKKTLPGLRKALLAMKPGDKWEVFIPPTNRNELTAKGGVIIYELELVAIHPPGSGS